jgi:hypothetical protein
MRMMSFSFEDVISNLYPKVLLASAPALEDVGDTGRAGDRIRPDDGCDTQRSCDSELDDAVLLCRLVGLVVDPQVELEQFRLRDAREQGEPVQGFAWIGQIRLCPRDRITGRWRPSGAVTRAAPTVMS